MLWALALLSNAMQVARRMRSLLIVVALLYAGSYLVGWYLISANSPIAVETGESLREAVLSEQPFAAIIQSLRGGEVVTAILVTFIVNLAVGGISDDDAPKGCAIARSGGGPCGNLDSRFRYRSNLP